MLSAFALLPLVILLIIVLGSGFVGLVFIAFMNIGMTAGAYYFTTSDFDIPAQDSQFIVEPSND